MLVAARLCLIALTLAPALGRCGPPFATDDPAVLDPRHVELLPFHQSTLAASARSGVLAGLESHFGVVEGLEVDLTTPLAFARGSGARTHVGYGDTTVALKYRLFDEAPGRPLVSLVPRINVSTGDAERGLGNGSTQIFVAASAQRNFAAFQSYVTAGYWLNRGANNRNYASAGWVVQREFGPRWTFGVELFANGRVTSAQPASAGFNAGGYYKLDPNGQMLFSAGRGLVHRAETNRASIYLGYLHSF